MSGLPDDVHRVLGLYVAVKPVLPPSHLNPDHPGTPKAWNRQARAGVAQLVERKALNLVVKGSSPFFGDRNLFLHWALFALFIHNAQGLFVLGANKDLRPSWYVSKMSAAKMIAESGNWTPASRVTGGNTDHYTNSTQPQLGCHMEVLILGCVIAGFMQWTATMQFWRARAKRGVKTALSWIETLQVLTR